MKVACAVVAIVLLLSPMAAPGGDTEAVRKVFSDYRAALLSGQGDTAARLLSRSTHDYYDQMRRIALHGDAEAVRTQSLVNQIQILLFRLRVPPDQLASLTPEGLIAHAVDRGWIGKSSVLQIQPGNVVSEGDAAVLHVVVDGRDVGPAFRFDREPEGWRLDLLPALKSSNTALQLAAKREGVSEDELLLVLMESVLGRKPGPEAWIPPRGADPAP